MQELLLVVRLVLTATFLVAAVAKALDLVGTRRSLERFGAPARLAAPAAVLLPALELAVAGALVPAASARWGALGALILLAVFCAAVGRVLARGEEVDCNCFGALNSKPADSRLLARNAVLAALAGFVLVAGWNGAGSDPNATTGVIALALAALGLGAFAWMTLRQNGHLLLKLDAMESELRTGSSTLDLSRAQGPPPQGLPVGAPAPELRVHDLDGEVVTLNDLVAHRPRAALVFTDPECSGCHRLLPALAGLADEHDDALRVHVVVTGSVRAARDLARQHRLPNVLVQPDHAVNLLFRASTLPSAVVLDADGFVATELAKGPDAVAALLAAQGSPADPVVMVTGS
jgi:thiol-disulfide isomerase/thioredoxin